MNVFKQLIAVTLLGLRNIPSRLGASLVVVIGMACVVGVVVSILSMSTGFMRSMDNSGRDDRAIVLSQAAVFEIASFIPRAAALTIADAPGVKNRRRQSGRIRRNARLCAHRQRRFGRIHSLPQHRAGSSALRPEIKLISGRMFNPAVHELIVGKSVQTEFVGLNIGSQVSLPDGDWTVTGSFEAAGSALESELLGDSATLLSALRFNGYKSVRVMLESPGAFDQFKAAVTSNPALLVDVSRERDWIATQSRIDRFSP
jgi:putative ABC transport system permease protein